MDLYGKDAIIQLGRVLAEEERRGFDNGAVAAGLGAFLARWRQAANGALAYEPVQHALKLLEDYDTLDIVARRARVGIALAGLRALFRGRKPEARGQVTGSGKTARPGDEGAARPAAGPKPQVASQPLTLDASIEAVPGIGRANAQAFRRLGVRTVHDLLYHFPHRYDDYSRQKKIGELEIGAVETVVGVVTDVRTFAMRAGQGLEVTVEDETGVLKAVFFRQPWIAKQLPAGTRVVLSGKVTLDSYRGVRQMSAPQWEPFTEDELIHTGRLVPVHPLTKGLVERNARRIIKQVVDRAAPLVPEYLPAAVRERAGLLPLPEALAQIHFPSDAQQLQRARVRLGFDEFLFIQLGVLQRRVLWQGERGHPMTFHEDVHAAFLATLPFGLTGAQQRAIAEIAQDIARPVPMARLLQGDVGSGKTVVAAATALQAVANGFQAAIMAPTEILAEQHYKGLKALLRQVRVPRGQGPAAGDHARQAPLAELAEIRRLIGMDDADDLEGQGVRVALLTGSLGAKDRRKVLEAISRGEVDVIIGTHALISENVRYHALGLVVVDEQHRFGVEQRQRLRDKGFNPHMLVMTATPIPRTLTLTIYGDLDTSVLDELPPGRQEIKTRWITTAEREKAYKHIRQQIARGRQAFVICPLVEESEKVDLPSAEEMHARLAGEVFPDLRVALIHGKMLPREKDQVMLAFRNGEYDLLVATAVIEVGIDVPNAATILIEGADRFGLAQLHQFRGRVGRGEHQSYCILVSDRDNEVTRQRLEAMETTTDGFKLAEIDLQLRGPGEFFGTRQSGTPDLKIAQLADTRLLHAANREAQAILAEDPHLERPEHALLRAKMDAFWAEATKAG
jgi:ATP-dependent DNA helicase RecG